MTKRVALITGVSSGIGLVTARLMAERGWVVIGTTRTGKPVADLDGVAVDIQKAEMSQIDSLEPLVKTIVKTYGRIDALVLNAGYGRHASIEQITPQQMLDQVVVNTIAPAALIKAALPTMINQGGGVIVGMSSIAGRVGVKDFSLYSASKFGLEGLFESLRYELPTIIRLRLIEPGSVATKFWQGQQPRGSISAKDVAASTMRAIESESIRLHYPIGIVRWVLFAKWILPEVWFVRLISNRSHQGGAQ